MYTYSNVDIIHNAVYRNRFPEIMKLIRRLDRSLINLREYYDPTPVYYPA